MFEDSVNRKSLFEFEGKKYYYGDVVKALQAAGLRKGDTVMVHSELASFGKLSEVKDRLQYVECFIDALVECVGEQGNLIVPEFSYSFYRNELFDPQTSPTTLGFINEAFRKLPGVVRSINPMLSVSAIGPDKQFYTDVSNECYGKGSVFDKMFARNSKMAFLGRTFDITFLHYIEHSVGVGYRPMLYLTGKVKTHKGVDDYVCHYSPAPKQEGLKYDLEALADFLAAKSIVKSAPLANSRVRVVGCKQIFKEVSAQLGKNELFLVKEGAGLRKPKPVETLEPA